MNCAQMKNRCLDLLNERGGALLHELVAFVGDEARGDVALAINENVIVWTNVSETFVQAFNLLSSEIEIHRANPLIYAVDSIEGFPGLPVVSVNDFQTASMNYDEPHWLPIVVFLKKENNEQLIQNNSSTAVSSAAPVGESAGSAAPEAGRSSIHRTGVQAERVGESTEAMPSEPSGKPSDQLQRQSNGSAPLLRYTQRSEG